MKLVHLLELLILGAMFGRPHSAIWMLACLEGEPVASDAFVLPYVGIRCSAMVTMRCRHDCVVSIG